MSELGHVAFQVRDLQDSLRFYTQAVGLELRGHILEDEARCSVAAEPTTNGCLYR